MTSDAKKIQPVSSTTPRPKSPPKAKPGNSAAPRPKPVSVTSAAQPTKPTIKRPLSVVPNPAPFRWTPICDSVERDLNMSADELISPRGLP